MTIKDIERKLTELVLRERALVDERDKARGRLLYNAEKHPAVNRIVDDVFVSALGIDRNSIDRYAQPGRSAVLDGVDRLSEVVVHLSAVPLDGSPLEDFAEIGVRLRLKKGFDDGESRLSEERLGAEIHSLRDEIARLRELKRTLRDEGTPR